MAWDVNLRHAGVACIASGALGGLVGVFTLAYPKAVDDDVWSYPFPFGVGLIVGLLLAVIHVLTLVGFVGAREAHARAVTPAMSALLIAIVGYSLLAACEVASGLIGRADVDSTTAGAVGSGFGLASLAIALGSVWGGFLLLRRRPAFRTGAGAMLASGLVLILLVTPANVSGNLPARTLALILWSICFIPLGWDVARTARTASIDGGRNGG